MAQASGERRQLGRLQLCPRLETEGAVDGAWWPRSADLGRELPDLMAVFGSLIGEVRRVVYDTSMWRTAPSRVIRGNTAISIDSYRLVAHDTIYLLGTHARDAVLYVLPAELDQPSADRVLRAVLEQAHTTCVPTLRYLLTHAVRPADMPMPLQAAGGG